MYKIISNALICDDFTLNNDSCLDIAFMRSLNEDGIAILDNVLIPESDYDLVFYLICFGSIPDKLFYLELLYQFHGINMDYILNNYSSISLCESEFIINSDDYTNDIELIINFPLLSSQFLNFKDESNVDDLDVEGFGLPSDYFSFE